MGLTTLEQEVDHDQERRLEEIAWLNAEAMEMHKSLDRIEPARRAAFIARKKALYAELGWVGWEPQSTSPQQESQEDPGAYGLRPRAGLQTTHKEKTA